MTKTPDQLLVWSRQGTLPTARPLPRAKAPAGLSKHRKLPGASSDSLIGADLPSALRSFSMSAHTFNVVYEDAGDGWVYAHVPELPEVHTQGDTLDQARDMVRDAITLVLDERRSRGEEIPPTGWALVESVEIAA